MEHLASLVHISVVTSGHSSLTRELGVEVRGGEKGVVHTRFSRDGVTEPLERITIVSIIETVSW